MRAAHRSRIAYEAGTCRHLHGIVALGDWGSGSAHSSQPAHAGQAAADACYLLLYPYRRERVLPDLTKDSS